MRWSITAIVALLAIPAMAGCLEGTLLDPNGVGPKDYLRDGKYTEWIIEVDYVSGHRPTQSALDLLETRLEAIAKKDTITILVDDAIAGGSSWSSSDIEALQRAHKDHKTGGNTIVTWMVYLDGEFSGNTQAIGVTFNYDRIAIFDEKVDSTAFLTITPTDIEKAVLVHEFGHAVGLVARGLTMVNDHEDDEHPAHSDNENSVMFWAVESTQLRSVISGSIPTRFDADDLADICNAGGKC